MVYIPVGFDCICPDTDTVRPLFIAKSALDKMPGEPSWLRKALPAVPEVTNRTATNCVVFPGLNREQFSNATVYCGHVDPPERRRVLLAYVIEPKPGELAGPILIWWEWRAEDPNWPGRPVNWKEDFGEPKWTASN